MKVKNLKVVTGTFLSLGFLIVSGVPAIAQGDCVAVRRRAEQAQRPVVQEPVQEQRVYQRVVQQEVIEEEPVEQEIMNREVVEQERPVRAMW